MPTIPRACLDCGQPTRNGTRCQACTRAREATRPSFTERRHTTGWKWAAIRDAVRARDHHTCTHCGATDHLHVHHIVPLHQGGTNDPGNLTTVCRACHGKAHRRHTPTPPEPPASRS